MTRKQVEEEYKKLMEEIEENKAQETTKLLKHRGLAESTLVTEEYYSEEKINKIVGKISDSIQEYINKYKKRPLIIMISRPLEIIMVNKIDIMHHRQAINIGIEPMIVNFVFGIPVLTTPVLEGLEFEIF